MSVKKRARKHKAFTKRVRKSMKCQEKFWDSPARRRRAARKIGYNYY